MKLQKSSSLLDLIWLYSLVQWTNESKTILSQICIIVSPLHSVLPAKRIYSRLLVHLFKLLATHFPHMTLVEVPQMKTGACGDFWKISFLTYSLIFRQLLAIYLIQHILLPVFQWFWNATSSIRHPYPGLWMKPFWLARNNLTLVEISKSQTISSWVFI